MNHSARSDNYPLATPPATSRAWVRLQPTKQVGRQVAYAVATLGLAAIYLLLPIERGFPVIRILGYPFTLTLLASVAAFGFVIVDSNGTLFYHLPRRYLPFQILVTLTLFISALIASNVQAGLFVVLSYFATFVLNFLVIDYLFQRGFRRAFVLLVCGVAVVAAAVGIVEGLFHSYVSVYADWFLGYDYAAMSYAMTRADFRVLGTLGNPILYAVAMTLTVPFAGEIRNRVMRYGLVAALFLASGLALSTTAVLVWFVFGLGFAVLSRHRKRLILLTIALASLGLGLRASLAGDDTVSFDMAMLRLVGGNPDNTNIRQQLLNQTLESFRNERSVITILFGHGLKSTIEACPQPGHRLAHKSG